MNNTENTWIKNTAAAKYANEGKYVVFWRILINQENKLDEYFDCGTWGIWREYFIWSQSER